MSREQLSLGTAGTSRRRFLRGVAGLSLGAASLGALAACRGPAIRPAAKRMPLIGYLDSFDEADQASAAAVREGLVALGYREGQTVQIEWRHGGNDVSRWYPRARELAGLHPDVIVMRNIGLVRMLHSITQTIPIVVALPSVGPEDLIAAGLIKSQAHPGGNITGLLGAGSALAGKRLDLLHETLPSARRLALLRFSGDDDVYLPYPAWAGDAIALSVSTPDFLDDVFVKFEEQHAELLVVDDRGYLLSFLDQVAAQARRRRLPAIGGSDAFAVGGGLMSYASDQAALYRGSGRFVDKILRGASPADLPVELPTAFNFIINKGTASALGLTIPPALLAQATEVLQ